MAPGEGGAEQRELFIATTTVVKARVHPYYRRLNQLLAEMGFDAFVEWLRSAYYQSGGRPSIPPGVSFRMLSVG